MRRPVGRPKAKKPRIHVKSIRLNEEEVRKIKKRYKTFANMIKEVLAVLSVCILITSCGGGTGSSASQNPEQGLGATTGEIYARAQDIRKPYSLGYDLSYSCSGDTCSFTGELHHWNIAGTFVTKTQINTASLTKSGSVYVGIIYTVSGQAFNASVNIAQNFVKIDNGVNCTRTQESTTQNGYDAYLGGVSDVDAAIAFNALTIGQCEL